MRLVWRTVGAAAGTVNSALLTHTEPKSRPFFQARIFKEKFSDAPSLGQNMSSTSPLSGSAPENMTLPAWS